MTSFKSRVDDEKPQHVNHQRPDFDHRHKDAPDIHVMKGIRHQLTRIADVLEQASASMQPKPNK